MNLRRCEKGHFYNAEKYTICPHCIAEEMEKNRKTIPEWLLDDTTDTEEIDGDFNDNKQIIKMPDPTGLSADQPVWNADYEKLSEESDIQREGFLKYHIRPEDLVISTRYTEVKFFYDRGYVIQRAEFKCDRERQTLLIHDVFETDRIVHVHMSDGVRCHSQSIVQYEQKEQEMSEDQMLIKEKKELRQQIAKERKRLLFYLTEQERILCREKNDFTKSENETSKEYFDELLEKEFEIRNHITDLSTKEKDIREKIHHKNIDPDQHALKLDIEAVPDQNYVIEIISVTEKLFWKPKYELYASSETDQIKMVLDATICNTTYKDFENVKVTFSTGVNNPKNDISLERLNILKPLTIKRKVNLLEQEEPTLSMEGNMDMLTDTQPMAACAALRYNENDMELHDMEVVLTNERKRPYCKELVMKELYTFYGCEESHKIFLMEKRYPVEKYYFAIPKRDESVYFSIHISEFEKWDLLECDVAIYLDENYVRSINTVSENMNEQIIIGRISGVRVQKETITDKEEKRLLSGTHILRKKDLIIAENMRNDPISLRVMDQVPITWEEDVLISIEDLSQGELNQKNGLCSWNITLDAKEKKELMMHYTISYPSKEEYIVE